MPDDQQQNTDQQGQQGTGDATGQQTGTQASQQGNGGSGEDKKFSQAELDAIVKDRLDRERKTAETKAQRDREAADAKALEDQKEFQKLAEQRQARIAELEPAVQKSERYEAALTRLLEGERKNLPTHITALLDKLDPAEQLEWIAENREALGKTSEDDTKKTANKGTATDMRADKPNGALSDEQRAAAAAQTVNFYRSTF